MEENRNRRRLPGFRVVFIHRRQIQGAPNIVDGYLVNSPWAVQIFFGEGIHVRPPYAAGVGVMIRATIFCLKKNINCLKIRAINPNYEAFVQ